MKLTLWDSVFLKKAIVDQAAKIFPDFMEPNGSLHTRKDSVLSQLNPVHISKTTFPRFEVLTAASMKMTVSWDAPCSLVEVYRLIVLMLETASTSETSVYFYQTTRRNIPEDSHLPLPKSLFPINLFS
jgi:hypothetical protein